MPENPRSTLPSEHGGWQHRMFARFGPESRRVIELAEDHARALWRPAVGPEHLLLALLAVDDTGVFVRAGLRFDDVRGRLVEQTGSVPVSKARTLEARHLPLRLRTVFRDAFRAAVTLESPEVGPLHLALALLEHPPGEVAMVLRGLNISAEAVAAAVHGEIAAAQAAVDDDGGRTVVALRRISAGP